MTSNPATPGATAPVQEAAHAAAATAALTRKQRNALFDAAAQGITPELKKQKAVDPMREWAPQIRRMFKRGFSAQQIVTIASSPKINLTLSVRAIKQLIAKRGRRGAASASRGKVKE